LLQTIQRIVQENERLSGETDTKSQRIEKLTDQVNELIQKNQSVVDENNRYYQDRNRNLHLISEETKKQIDKLTDERDQLQIELADLKTTNNKTETFLDSLKKSTLV